MHHIWLEIFRKAPVPSGQSLLRLIFHLCEDKFLESDHVPVSAVPYLKPGPRDKRLYSPPCQGGQ